VLMHSVRAGMYEELMAELVEVGGHVVSVLPDGGGAPCPVVIEVTWDEPLWWAAYFGQSELIEKLVSLGVNVAVTDTHHRNLFHWCSLWGLPQHSDVLKVLCATQSPAASAPDAFGMTPFDVAKASGNAANAGLLPGEGDLNPVKMAQSWDEAKAIAAEMDQPFVDQEFDANLTSLCHTTNNAIDINPRFSGVEWKRPNELIEGSVARLDLASMTQVELGCCGNSWLLSSALLASTMPYGLTTIFDQCEIDPSGCYSFTFRFNGYAENVLIDDRIPCLDGAPMYGGFGAANNIAFMLLEKALAKLIGSYEGLTRGSSTEKFQNSELGKELYSVCKPPSMGETETSPHYAELNELLSEMCQTACVMMLEGSSAMFGDHSSSESVGQIADFFSQLASEGTDRLGIRQHQGSRHSWAAEPKRVLPGTGSCSCQEPVVTVTVNVKSRVRVELDSAESAENIRIYQTGSMEEDKQGDWNFIWRHAVPGSLTEFDLLLDASIYPYIIFFTQIGTGDASSPCHFNLWSDKELIIETIDNNEDLKYKITKLT